MIHDEEFCKELEDVYPCTGESIEPIYEQNSCITYFKMQTRKENKEKVSIKNAKFNCKTGLTKL